MLPFWLDLKSIHEFYFFIIFFYFFSFGPGNIFTFSHHNAFTLPGNIFQNDTIFLYYYILYKRQHNSTNNNKKYIYTIISILYSSLLHHQLFFPTFLFQKRNSYSLQNLSTYQVH